MAAPAASSSTMRLAVAAAPSKRRADGSSPSSREAPTASTSSPDTQPASPSSSGSRTSSRRDPQRTETAAREGQRPSRPRRDPPPTDNGGSDDGGDGAPSTIRQQRFSGERLHSRDLTREIAAVGSLAQLSELLEIGLQQRRINGVHLSTAWSRLVKLWPSPRAPRAVHQRAPPRSPDGKERGRQQWRTSLSRAPSPAAAADADAAAPAAAAAEALQVDGDALVDARALYDALLAATNGVMLAGMQPRALSTVVWAVAKVEGQEGRAGSGSGSGSHGATVGALLRAWCAAASGQLSVFNAQDLSSSLWALGRLGHMPSDLLMKQLSICCLKLLPSMDAPQQLSNCALGMALLRWSPPVRDFWPAFWVAVKRVVLEEQRQPDTQAISNILWSAAQLVGQSDSLAKGSGMAPSVPKDILSASVFRFVQWSDRVNATQCQDLLTALPKLGWQPTQYQGQKVLAACGGVLANCDAQALSNILLALEALRVQLTGEWLRAYMAAFRAGLPSSRPEAQARLLYALVQLPARKWPKWLPELWAMLEQGARAGRLSASDIAFAAVAVKRMFAPRTRQAEGDDAPTDDEPQQGAADDNDNDQEADEAEEASAAGRRPLPPRRVMAAPPDGVMAALAAAWAALPEERKISGVVFDLRAEVQEYLADPSAWPRTAPVAVPKPAAATEATTEAAAEAAAGGDVDALAKPAAAATAAAAPAAAAAGGDADAAAKAEDAAEATAVAAASA